MSAEDRARWDAVYRKRKPATFPPPDPLLFEFVPPAPGREEQRALDLAGGVGQNGLWLAGEGYVVDVMDISRVALAQGQTEMQRRGLTNLNFIPVDLDGVTLEANTYAVVCVFRYLERGLFPKIRASIRKGGRIIYETFNLRYLDIRPQFNRDYLLESGELNGYFADWRILNYSEDVHVTRLVAIKT